MLLASDLIYNNGYKESCWSFELCANDKTDDSFEALVKIDGLFSYSLYDSLCCAVMSRAGLLL